MLGHRFCLPRERIPARSAGAAGTRCVSLRTNPQRRKGPTALVRFPAERALPGYDGKAAATSVTSAVIPLSRFGWSRRICCAIVTFSHDTMTQKFFLTNIGAKKSLRRIFYLRKIQKIQYFSFLAKVML